MSEVIESRASQQSKPSTDDKAQNKNRPGRRVNNRSRRKRDSEDSSYVKEGEDDDSNAANRLGPANNNGSRKRDATRRESSRSSSRGTNKPRRAPGADAPPIVDDGASYKAKMNRNYHNSIFIGNLPYNCTGEDLTDGFNKFGQVIRSDIVTQKGRHRGMGTVEFRDFASVLKAIRKMNNEQFMGRIIFVRKDNPPPEEALNSTNHTDDEATNRRNRDEGRRDRSVRKNTPNNKTKSSKYDEVGEHSMSAEGYEIFAANLPFSTKAQDLFEMFSKFGNVIYAKVIRDREGRSRGYGVCNMETKEQAMSVLQFCHNLDIEGRKLDCKVGKVGWSAPPALAVENDKNSNTNTATEDSYTITESELTERERIKQREAERSMRDQGTFSFMDDIISGGTGITKISTNEKEDFKNSEQEGLNEKAATENSTNNIEPEKGLPESCFILLGSVSTDADHNDIVELCQSFGTIISSSREHISPVNPLYDNNTDALSDPETVIVQFDHPVTDESCVKVLNGFTYAGKELSVQLYKGFS